MHTLTTFSLRPCLLTKTDQNQSQFMDCLQRHVESSDRFQGEFKSGHAMISIVEAQRHFWSPWMQLEYRQLENALPHHESSQEENVIARFSPHPSIWTGFMLSYLSLAVLVFFSLVLGYSQQLAQQWAWGYYTVPVWFAAGLVLWIASQVGQRLAVKEMEALIEIVKSCLNEKT